MSRDEQRLAEMTAITKACRDYSKKYNEYISVFSDPEDMKVNGGTCDEPFTMFSNGKTGKGYMQAFDDNGERIDYDNGKQSEYNVDPKRIVSFDLPPLPEEKEP